MGALLVALAAAVYAEPEADAAADAWYGYYGYGRPWGYYGAYRGYYGYPYRGYYGRCWKRDAEASPSAVAEAEPEADAAADAYYGYYGYGGYYGAYRDTMDTPTEVTTVDTGNVKPKLTLPLNLTTTATVMAAPGDTMAALTDTVMVTTADGGNFLRNTFPQNTAA